RGNIWDIAVGAGGFRDAEAGLERDRFVAGERARHRGDRHAELVSKLLERLPPHRHRSSLHGFGRLPRPLWVDCKRFKTIVARMSMSTADVVDGVRSCLAARVGALLRISS